jgi:uncharacterized sodium:solute symporter family permease YidK|tara:strand:- start:1028 stop:1294 length:267 start_codon:yes stop_codon:yes gene_type:complete
VAIHNSVAAVAEHSMVKAMSPFIIAFLIGAVSWMFSSVIDLQNQMTLFSEGKLKHLEQQMDKLSQQVDVTNSLVTDIRIAISPRVREH